MSNIEEARRAFYDDSDPFALDSSTTISTVGPTRNAASSSSNSSSTAAGSSTRPAPYPNRSSSSYKAKGRHNQQSRYGATAEDSGSSTAYEYDTSSSTAFDYGMGLRTQDIADADMELDGNRSGATRARRAEAGVMTRRGEENDVQKMLRAWRNERHAPDILPSKNELLVKLLDEVRSQTNDVNALRTADDLTEEDHYMMMLVQTEVERIKFIVRSYVRARLYKIEKYAAYILSDEHKAEIQPRLTGAELTHATRYGVLLKNHFDLSVLNHLPDSQRGMDDDVPMVPSMATEPDKEKAVFFHALEDCGQVRLPDGTGYHVHQGSIHLMRYRTIEHLLLRDEIELV